MSNNKDTSGNGIDESVCREPLEEYVDLGYFVPFLLSRLHNHFQHTLQSALEPYDLIVPEWRVLLCLSQMKEHCTLQQITHLIRLPHSTTSRTVTRLAAKGLIDRAWQDQDKRIRDITLSSKGRDLFKELHREVRSATDDEVARLAGPDAEQWVATMRKILSQLAPDPRFTIKM